MPHIRGAPPRVGCASNVRAVPHFKKPVCIAYITTENAAHLNGMKTHLKHWSGLALAAIVSLVEIPNAPAQITGYYRKGGITDITWIPGNIPPRVYETNYEHVFVDDPRLAMGRPPQGSTRRVFAGRHRYLGGRAG